MEIINKNKEEPKINDDVEYDDIFEDDEEVDEDYDSDEDNTIPEIANVDLCSKEKFYFKMVDKYYKILDNNLIEKMIDIVKGKSTISLRLLDWFVTRYSDKHKTYYQTPENDRFSVHISYKAQLKSYKKRYFDPFRRNKKFKYYFGKENKDKKLCTTIGQLNFFRWAFTNQIIKYVDDHYKELTDAMVVSNKEDKKRKKNKKNKKDDDSTDVVKISKAGIDVVAKKKITSKEQEQSKDNKMKEVKIILSFD
jgi:hypothetical protein